MGRVPNQIPTKDKKYILVDATARWKITDPLKFIQTVQNERGTKSRLDAITRDTTSNNNLVEAVRNSNTIMDVIKERQTMIARNGVNSAKDEITYLTAGPHDPPEQLESPSPHSHVQATACA